MAAVSSKSFRRIPPRTPLVRATRTSKFGGTRMTTDKLRPVHPQEEADDFRRFHNLELSPEEFAARHGHEFAMFPFHQNRYQRPGMTEWVQQLAQVFFAPGLPDRLRRLRERYLTPEEIERVEEYER